MIEARRKGRQPVVDEQLELDIADLTENGVGVARSEGFVFFVRGARLGQRVQARVTAVKKNLAEAVAEREITPSPLAREPFCPHFGRCGGCLLQDLDYAAQLDWKANRVRQALARIAKAGDAAVLPALASPLTRGYRNKMEFAFGGTAGPDLTLGLRERDRPDRVLDLATCHLCSETAFAVMDAFRDLARASGLPAYAQRSGRGLFRHLMVRHFSSGAVQVNCITTPDRSSFARVMRLGEELMARRPEVKGFVHSVREDQAALAQGEQVQAVAGDWQAEESLGGLRFMVSAEAFFQVNTQAAEILLRTVADLGRFTGRETLWDLYCGGGSIGLCLAGAVGRVEGFEVASVAVEDARANAALNGVENCRFTAVDLKGLREHLAGLPRPDVVVCDPPRAGLDETLTQTLLEVRPPVVLAVSCNPATLARDLGRLSGVYALSAAQPVDLFPHTPHVECVVRLDLVPQAPAQ